jgi:hypothetical protein
MCSALLIRLIGIKRRQGRFGYGQFPPYIAEAEQLIKIGAYSAALVTTFAAIERMLSSTLQER